jgi:hypothetical protein
MFRRSVSWLQCSAILEPKVAEENRLKRYSGGALFESRAKHRLSWRSSWFPLLILYEFRHSASKLATAASLLQALYSEFVPVSLDKQQESKNSVRVDYSLYFLFFLTSTSPFILVLLLSSFSSSYSFCTLSIFFQSSWAASSLLILLFLLPYFSCLLLSSYSESHFMISFSVSSVITSFSLFSSILFFLHYPRVQLYVLHIGTNRI